MSPRTDESIVQHAVAGVWQDYVHANFARALELDLACYREENERILVELARVTAERDAIHELLSCYNLGGWTDALAPMQRALTAEADLARVSAELEEAKAGKAELNGVMDALSAIDNHSIELARVTAERDDAAQT